MRSLSAAVLLTMSSLAHAGLITVDVTGSGDHTTIAAGVAAAGAGDTVLVRDGAYDERITVTANGTAAAPLVIRAENRRSASLRGFTVESDYVTIDGFEIFNTDTVSWRGEDAVRVEGGSHIRVVNNHLHDIKRGAGVWTGPHAYVADNLIENVYLGLFMHRKSVAERNRIADIFEASWNAYGRRNSFVFMEGDSITCRGNYLWDDTTFGSTHFFHASDWTEFNPVATYDILIEGNICFNAVHGSEPDGARRAESVRWTYRNNVFVNTRYVGICPKYLGEVKILNNTFINCGVYPVWYQYNVAGGNEVKNNIFAKIDGYVGSATPQYGWDMDHSYPPEAANNLYAGYKINKFPGTNEKTFTPSFVNASVDTATADFMLTGTCDAVDGGIATDLVTTDFRGYGRPAGNAIDVGAYEYGAVPVSSIDRPAVRITTKHDLGVHPQPAAGAFTVSGNRVLGGVKILNTAGQVVWQGSTGTTMLRIAAGSALPPGQYVIVTDDGTQLTQFTISR